VALPGYRMDMKHVITWTIEIESLRQLIFLNAWWQSFAQSFKKRSFGIFNIILMVLYTGSFGTMFVPQGLMFVIYFIFDELK